MNIDKIYKPIRPIPLKDPILLPVYDPDEVQELEEKYKELLVFIDHIKECIDINTWGLDAIDEILERHLGSEIK